MTLPSDLQSVLNLAESAARAGLKDFQASQGATEAAQAVEEFATHGKEIVTRFATGKMNAEAARRAFTSRRGALTFTLAAIAHENKRAWLEQLLGTALKFVASILTPAK